MTQADRIMLVVVVVLVDILFFALPVTAFFAAYVILARPIWFREWVERLYE